MQSASGTGSASIRKSELGAIMARSTPEEQTFLIRLISGELRQGALAGIMTDAVASAAGVEPAAVRRAAMFSGSLPAVAAAVFEHRESVLGQFHLMVGTPVQPMLAQSAASVESAIERTGAASVEWKLDGIRIQAHRHNGTVEVFSRSLDRITARMPEIVRQILDLPVSSIVLDGEAIALRDDGRPRPFQETGSRAASHRMGTTKRADVALTAFYFDILHLNGEDLVDRTAHERLARARAVLPASLRVPSIATADLAEAQAFFEGALNAGHEGVVVKSLSSPYEAGRRGTGWIKVKPHHTLDLVVLAAEWGHGRRQGFLSNLHLGAIDPATGGYVMLGKTFKGLTDDMLRWQTARLQEIETRRDTWTVYVRPELIVEIAFDGIQTSTRYPGGMALRFARVVRYRDDKPVTEVDTIDTLRALHAGKP
jgi:DNA ligase-1